MTLTGLVALALSAILVENFVLVQFLGICPFLGVSQKTETATGMGMAVTFVMALASMLTWLVNLLLVQLGLEYMRTVAFILIIASLVQLVEMFLQKAIPALYTALGIYLPLITTNCAVLGVALLHVRKDMGFLEATAYGFFAGIGFLVAIVLFASIRERLEVSSDSPKSFEGVPMSLVTAGLLAMAFMGFSGLQVF